MPGSDTWKRRDRTSSGPIASADDTVRSRAPEVLLSQAHIEQFRQFQDALRLAGLRDHADEDADFGVPAFAALRSGLAGLTPKDAPGVTTLHTADFVQFLAESKSIVIDTMTYFGANRFLEQWG